MTQTSRYPLTCETDEQAIAVAREYVDGYAVELWDKTRKIAHFSPIQPIE
jgi:hypothetical protein